MFHNKKYRINNQLSLKQISVSDTETFYNSLHSIKNFDDKNRTHLQLKYDRLEKTRLSILDAVESKFKLDGTPDFFILFNEKIVGMFEFHPLTNQNYIEVGYWLYLEYRRQGILSSVFPVMIDYAADNFSKEKILATTATTNIASQALLSKIGFNKTDNILEFKNSKGEMNKEYEYLYLLANKH